MLKKDENFFRFFSFHITFVLLKIEYLWMCN